LESLGLVGGVRRVGTRGAIGGIDRLLHVPFSATGHRDDAVSGVGLGESHALRGPTGPRDLDDGGADHLARGHDAQDLVTGVGHQGTHEVASGLDEVGDLDAQAATALDGVVDDVGALGVAALGDDEQVGDRRGDEQHEQPRGQGPREAPGVGPSGSEEEREEPRREHVDEREGDDADQDRPLDGDPHQRPHLTGLDRGELLEEDLGHRAVDEDEWCVQVAPGRLELAQRGDRVVRDEQLDAVEAQGVRQGVGAVEQRHAPGAAGAAPRRGEENP